MSFHAEDRVRCDTCGKIFVSQRMLNKHHCIRAKGSKLDHALRPMDFGDDEPMTEAETEPREDEP